MSRKRTSLDSILREPGRTEPEPTTAAAPQPAEPRRRSVKQQTVYLPIPVYEQLRTLAFEERAKMHTLLMEGLDRVFQDRGLASLDELQKDTG